jgi:hypothetical protein
MLRVLKHHIDGLIFQYNFLEGNNVLMAYLPVKLYYVGFKADNETNAIYPPQFHELRSG